MPEERRSGSIKAAYVTAIVLVVVTIVEAFRVHSHWADGKRDEYLINAFSSAIFGAVVLWWAVTPPITATSYKGSGGWKGHPPGIGNPTVMMVVSVVSAVVVIFTLTDAMYKSTP